LSDKNNTLDLEAQPLVDASWLAANLAAPGLRIIDTRWRGDNSGEQLYRAGHIPGAFHLDWQTDFGQTRFGVDYLLLSPLRFASLMGSLGINEHTRVIAYADHNYSGAARLWWALRYYGHDQVGVLDGGIDSWLAAGNPVDTAIPQADPAEFNPQPRPNLLATAAEIESIITDSNLATQLVDTRPPEQYAGLAVWTPGGSLFLPEDSDWVAVKGRPLKGGRLPGAVNLESSGLLDHKTWSYLTPQKILEQTQALGLDPEKRVITYCGCGVSASLGLFALRLAGFKDLALYDGSWEEWGRDPAKPIERDNPEPSESVGQDQAKRQDIRV
jgi:thiosulfate/3-mercaptopyruvate sulfurtransferase